MAGEDTFDNVYREIYELKAAVAWTAATLGCALSAISTGMPWGPALALTSTSLAMGAYRTIQAKRLIDAKVSLAGHQFWMLKADEYDKIIAAQKGKLYLGRGFRWTAKHTARAMELVSSDLSMKLPPKWLLKAMNRPCEFTDIKGETWLHGLEPKESDIAMPFDHVEGNWSIFGTTGAGKTRLYEMLTYQMVARGDAVIFFDPKFDKDLRDTLKKVCIKAGRPEAFAEFHPAFPKSSVRIDPLANFANPTEIASRICDPLSGGGPQDTFIATVWRLVNAITDGLVYTGQKPSLRLIRYYAEGGPEPLLEVVLSKFLKSWQPSTWEDHVNTLASQISQQGNKMKTTLATGSPRQKAMVQVYTEMVPKEERLDSIDGLVSISVHSREHLGKMIMTLLPLLTQLTSGALGELLSPDYNDVSDKREILDMQKVIRGRRVLYVATNSLADATVGSAIAAILLSDLRAEAGARYNYGDGQSAGDKTRIHIVCDEAAELVTPPLIAIMNKGRGAGMISYLATQNFSDYIAKFGDEHRARMVVGNGNNRLSLRVVDTYTQQYMVEQFGEVSIDQVSRGISSNTESEAQGLELRGGTTTSLGKQKAELFPGYLLGRLPDLHFVAAISGGRVFKGRIPKLVH